MFADGAPPETTKQRIAVAVARVTQCPYCIRGHARLVQRRGASEQEIMEAIWVVAEMRAGGAYAHSVIALDELVTASTEPAGIVDERDRRRQPLMTPHQPSVTLGPFSRPLEPTSSARRFQRSPAPSPHGLNTISTTMIRIRISEP